MHAHLLAVLSRCCDGSSMQRTFLSFRPDHSDAAAALSSRANREEPAEARQIRRACIRHESCLSKGEFGLGADAQEWRRYAGMRLMQANPNRRLGRSSGRREISGIAPQCACGMHALHLPAE